MLYMMGLLKGTEEQPLILGSPIAAVLFYTPFVAYPRTWGCTILISVWSGFVWDRTVSQTRTPINSRDTPTASSLSVHIAHTGKIRHELTKDEKYGNVVGIQCNLGIKPQTSTADKWHSCCSTLHGDTMSHILVVSSSFRGV